MPRVSVVSGYYNRGHLLKRTVDSIAAQTYRDFELIIFDDSSTDDTAERLADIARDFGPGNFKAIVHESNKGFVQGLIEAIDGSSGEYIAIQGSGDVSLPSRLSRQVQFLDAHPEVAVVGSWYYNVSEDIGARRLRRPDAGGVDYDSLLSGNIFSHGEVMIRRSYYERAGGYRPQFKFSQDYDLWLRLSRFAEFGTVEEAVYERYVQFDGVSYHPRKVIVQACYSVAARKMSAMADADERDALALLSREGPTAVVAVSDAEVQHKVRMAAARSLLFGSASNAAEIVRTGIVRPIERVTMLTVIKVFSFRLMRPVRTVVARAVGIDRS
ncbi:glycosyltransferase [Gordonia sp. NPDC127522]|uniref:glycosyltransferase n=1 Tax=Gordonia sp. NPDC127522 TaxID=3345390 RepID=UPI003640244C